jgi:hypothetical protein
MFLLLPAALPPLIYLSRPYYILVYVFKVNIDKRLGVRIMALFTKLVGNK